MLREGSGMGLMRVLRGAFLEAKVRCLLSAYFRLDCSCSVGASLAPFALLHSPRGRRVESRI
eukprot:6185175-Pleurochrysis_carterae.AAC.2